MKIRYDYMPFIAVFLICTIVIATIENVQPTEQEVSGQYEQVDAAKRDWYFERVGEGKRPSFPDYVKEYEQKYKVFFIGPEKKVLFLTFNCGYEYENYTLDFLDILKECDVKAAFFITGEYLRKNPEIVNRMLDEGHIVGNHGNTHADLSKLDAESLKKEIQDFEDSFEEVTGKKYSKKYFRPASGVYTELALAVARDLDYTTVFWSSAYEDWNTDNQPGAEVALSNIVKNSHDGCIYMLHTVSKSNRDALKQGITELKAREYEFKSLDQLVDS